VSDRPLGSVLFHPAEAAENDLLASVERPASRHADHRGATRVAVHLVLTRFVRSFLRTFSPIRPSLVICQPQRLAARSSGYFLYANLMTHWWENSVFLAQDKLRNLSTISHWTSGSVRFRRQSGYQSGCETFFCSACLSDRCPSRIMKKLNMRLSLFR
jgi:hypothetical protein